VLSNRSLSTIMSIKIVFFELIVKLSAFFWVFTAVNAQTMVYPLKISNNNRYLVDQNNRPFFLSGEGAFSLFVQLSKEDAEFYLQDRMEKGFNLLIVSLIEHQFCNNPPSNYYGDVPFNGEIFTTPNENYFAHVDYVINEAAKRGIVIMLGPLVLGYECGNEGWCQEVKAASLNDIRTWGQYVGNRYKDFDNITWAIGGDTDATPVRNKVLAFVNGILDYDTRHLFTVGNQPESFAITTWESEFWLNVNNVYSYSSTLYSLCSIAYNQSPVMPFFLLESAYENEYNTSQQRLRSQAYWTALSGGMGYVFGNCPIWHFGSISSWCGTNNWKGQMDSQGSISMMYFHKLFTSRDWYELVPDFNHTVMTSGYGSWGNTNYATAALSKDGYTMLAYLPSKRQVTIDMSNISGIKAICNWYNPSSGSFIGIGEFETSGNRNFPPPLKW